MTATSARASARGAAAPDGRRLPAGPSRASRRITRRDGVVMRRKNMMESAAVPRNASHQSGDRDRRAGVVNGAVGI